VNAKNLNVRAQATIASEVVKRLNPGDVVTVLEQTNLDKFQPNEPRQWAKIAYPEGVDVWIHSSFIDRQTMTVSANELNVRAGPGENYSVVGAVEKGAPVREILTDGNWTKIAAPSGTYAFVAAMYLQQNASAATGAPVVTATPVEPEVAAAPAATPSAAAPPVEEPAAQMVEVPPPVAAEPSGSNAPPTETMMTMPAPALLPAEPPVESPPPPRIVSHEGVVQGTVSIQAPTPYALVDPDTDRIVDYLYSTSTNLDMALYKGLRIVVTGEEGLDPRWTNSPVITIQRIHVIE
jgi:uncharacterized protein YgiM (DUF1202 family)